MFESGCPDGNNHHSLSSNSSSGDIPENEVNTHREAKPQQYTSKNMDPPAKPLALFY